ncbi:FecR domain-containing protein [Niabella sp. W65]|nr:FecR domain-containing protein [Niabella sp. W65]MCH7365132.1 FecR domain-containing protein [Niabella sp. W65]ULT40949.1 FecR domain-containing protein [Niabella sp. I65]
MCLLLAGLQFTRPKTLAATGHLDVQPGQTGAVLTLSDGSKIVLDSMGNGLVKKQDGAIIEIKNGQVQYVSDPGNAADALYNTMTTARGRQYQLVLADGTKVWLNAASSIKYPVAFSGKERNVTVSGEAYFEVSKNPHQPFTVTVNNGATTVQVLGTHFNINAYADEPAITTTLLEGRVKISTGSESKLLKVGQQAQTKAEQQQLTLRQAQICMQPLPGKIVIFRLPIPICQPLCGK